MGSDFEGSKFEDIAGRLDAIGEELADFALDRLRLATEDAGLRDRLVAQERRITRARRAVEKAAVLLHGPHSPEDDA